MKRLRSLLAAPALAGLALMLPACATAQEPAMPTIQPAPSYAPNSIQPETTITIDARGEVTAEPDIAYITMGVTTEAKTAEAALADNAKRMTGLFGVLKDEGIAERDIQTSNFSLGPRYSYPDKAPRRLDGFTASNQVTVRVRDLDNLGGVLDTVVREGGNTFGGLTFAVEDDTALRDEAREKAIKAALKRAELYASAAGLKVKRIVTIYESGGYDTQPQPMAAARMKLADEAVSPVASGELTYTASVNVMFELTK